MIIYERGTLEEWSRRLRTRYGSQFRLYADENETLERWADHLSEIYKRQFVVKSNLRETLNEWTKLIGG